MAGHWTLDDIPWNEFDASKIDPELIKVAKAAAMVESNGRQYADYLCNVFADDPEFCAIARAWAEEEVQHGVALGRWAKMADPTFDYDDRLKAFCDGYQIPIDVEESRRGSRAGEMVARCMVEIGTSSFYTALQDTTQEPVLRAICHRIAADELRHYKIFYKTLKRYLAIEKMGRLKRLRIALGRIAESEDDELAYAYYSANQIPGPYDRETNMRAYARRAFSLYRPRHVERAIGMVLKAVGLTANGWLNMGLTRILSTLMAWKVKRLVASAA